MPPHNYVFVQFSKSVIFYSSKKNSLAGKIIMTKQVLKQLLAKTMHTFDYTRGNNVWKRKQYIILIANLRHFYYPANNMF